MIGAENMPGGFHAQKIRHQGHRRDADRWLRNCAASADPDFIWAASFERGFVARASAAVLLLLGLQVLMNAITIFLRNRSEGRW